MRAAARNSLPRSLVLSVLVLLLALRAARTYFTTTLTSFPGT